MFTDLRYTHIIDFDAADLASTRRSQLFDGLVRLRKYCINVESASSLVVDIDDLLMVFRIVVI